VFDTTAERAVAAIACALALAVLAVSWRRGWARAGAWIALAAVGQAAALALYEAGPTVTYHHYRWRVDGQWKWPALAVLALQAALALAGVLAHRRAILAPAATAVRGWRLAALLALALVASAKISRPASQSVAEFVLATAIELSALATLALAAVSIPSGVLARFDRWLESLLGRARGVPEPGRADVFAWRVAIASTLAAALLCLFVYERHPHLPDEVVYLLNARYFADGRVALAPPPVPAAFDVDLMLLDRGQWLSMAPVGWPLALAAGALVGLPWLVNPLLGGATVLATYALARELADRRTARVVIALLAASPWFVFLNMSFMTHAWTLFCAVIAALGVARARRTGRASWCALGGAAIGMVSLIRPLEGLILAAALGLWAIGIGGARLEVAPIASLVLATAAVAAVALPFNAALTGDPKLFAAQHYIDLVYGPGKNDLGFGPEKGLGWGGLDPWPGHTPFQALVNAQFNLFAINAELFGWCAGSLALAAWLFAAGRRSRVDNLMLAFAAAIAGAHTFYWFAGGPDFGARYWYLAIVPLIWLTASGLRAVEARSREPARARAFVLALTAIACAMWMPWRALDKYLGYRGMRPGLRELARERDFGRSLVLIQGQRHPDYASAAILNPLDWDADAPIYAWDRDAEVHRALLEHYADRPVWLVAGPSVTGKGFALLGGPVLARDLLAEGK
jgi:hypothetical protein